MMAFFLLMWLLGSITAGDKKGIAEYFLSPYKVKLPGGSGSGENSVVMPGGGKTFTEKVGQSPQGSVGDPNIKKAAAEAMRAEAAKKEAKKMAAMAAKISSMISNDPRLSEFSAQIKLEVTPDGLLIQIMDDQRRPMFDLGSAIVKPYMRDILRAIGGALEGLENRISLDGHTDITPYGNGERGYSNWDLSADRANASRRELIYGGLPDNKLVRVVGMASSLLMNPDNPKDATNRRISILVMTQEAQDRILGASKALGDAAATTQN
jgi:chemotaxis protein MotB